MTEPTLATNNTEWGFWGTINRRAEPEKAWPLAGQAIAAATGCTDIAVRDFLDSRHGRHFADDVANGLLAGRGLAEAVNAAMTRWMAWTISRRTERETGIPKGLPYLTGFVTDFEILAEAVA
jgi:hypothetical protein